MCCDERQGWALFAVMAVLFLIGIMTTYNGEAAHNPAFRTLYAGQSAATPQAGGNMEGKEVRLGNGQSARFATITASSDGAVDTMHDSFMPMSGLVLLANMMLDEVVVGGPGSGLFGMLLFAIVAVFIAGLMIGRTPEYLGKKIEAKEIKMTMLVLLTVPAFILRHGAVPAALPAGLAELNNVGPRGFPSCFMPASEGTLPIGGAQFVGLLIGTVVIVGGLTFLPALALGRWPSPAPCRLR